MIQHILVFIIVAICIAVTIRLFYRVLAGKSSSCDFCDKCNITRKCADKPDECEEAMKSDDPPDERS